MSLQIQSLRTAFTLNTSLKRLFLTGTSLNSAGAIALAEFLPESTSLLHLDLTNNNLELAGVMALSEGLKANHVMRCLDLNIPPDDDEFARSVSLRSLVPVIMFNSLILFQNVSRYSQHMRSEHRRSREECQSSSGDRISREGSVGHDRGE